MARAAMCSFLLLALAWFCWAAQQPHSPPAEVVVRPLSLAMPAAVLDMLPGLGSTWMIQSSGGQAQSLGSCALSNETASGLPLGVGNAEQPDLGQEHEPGAGPAKLLNAPFPQQWLELGKPH